MSQCLPQWTHHHHHYGSYLPNKWFMNSGCNHNGSGTQSNGDIDVSYSQERNLYCSCDNGKSLLDKAEIKFVNAKVDTRMPAVESYTQEQGLGN